MRSTIDPFANRETTVPVHPAPIAEGLRIGGIDIANRVLLAPMSGITDAPLRRVAARLGAGLVVSEMTASDDLARGRAMSVLRCEATGIGPHVVQLAGCEAKWMAEGARIAESDGADIIDINKNCLLVGFGEFPEFLPVVFLLNSLF